MRYRPLLVSLILALAACGGGGGAGGADEPEKARVVDGKPVGLFFMTRFWSFTNSLEKVVWYFAPDGHVYQNLASGFSAEDLQAHQGKKGTYEVSDGKLKVTWADGKATESDITVDGTGFSWDGGIFTAIQPFDDRSLAGTYEGGESFNAGGGNSASASNTFELREDGTFKRSGVASVQSTSDASVVQAGGESRADGSWKAEGYSLVLTGSDGKVQRAIAFPYDDKDTPVYPDRMYFGGTMYARQ